jgi:hypothetical protein
LRAKLSLKKVVPACSIIELRATTRDCPYELKKKHSNPFLSALQFLAWLLFQPARWQDYLSTLNLSADFNLASLGKSQWRSPEVGRLLIIILVIWPLFVGSLVALGLYIIGRPWPNLIMAVTYGIVITMAGGFSVPLLFLWLLLSLRVYLVA